MLPRSCGRTRPGSRALASPITRRRKAPTSLANLQAQVDAAEAQIAQLHEQMLASSELIKVLAEQNTQLIARIETNRVRMLWIGAAAFTSLVGTATCLLLLLQR